MSLITNLENQNPQIANADTIKFFLKCDESPDVATLTDAVSGAILGSNHTPDGTGAIILGANSEEDFTGSSNGLSITSGKDWAVFCVINGAFLQSLKIGDQATDFIKISPAGSVSISGQTAVATFSNVGDYPESGITTKLLIACDASGSTTTYIAAKGDALVAGTPQLSSVFGDLTDISDVFDVAEFSGTSILTGFQLLEFANGLPTDIIVMADWTMEQWLANNKKFYPRITEL